MDPVPRPILIQNISLTLHRWPIHLPDPYDHLRPPSQHSSMKHPKWGFWLFLVAFYAFWILRATWFYSWADLSIPDPTWRMVFSDGVKFALWVVPAAVFVVWHDRQNPLKTMKVTTRMDPRGLLIGLGVSLGYFACQLLFAFFSAHQTLGPLLRAAPLTILGTLGDKFFSPICEELFFRGFVLPSLDQNMPFWPANLLQAVLFTAIHWPNWLWMSGLQVGRVATSLSILLLGLFFGWLTRRTNSVWPAVAMHILNNFIAAFLG